MVGRRRHDFEIVRRGYDVDQVDERIDAIERRWATELARTSDQLVEKDHRIAELQDLTSEVADAHRMKESLDRLIEETAANRQQILEEAAEQARERKAVAEDSASKLTFETEREMSRMRRKTEAALADLRTEAESRADRMTEVATADTKAMVEQAEVSIELRTRQTEERLAQRERDVEQQIEFRESDAERKHGARLRAYVRTEEELLARIEHLRSMRDSLIGSLQSIAEGGLTGVDEDLPESLKLEDVEAEFPDEAGVLVDQEEVVDGDKAVDAEEAVDEDKAVDEEKAVDEGEEEEEEEA